MHWLQHLPLLSLSGIAVSAAITPEGDFDPVGAMQWKIDAGLARGLLPRVHTLVVSDKQDLHDDDFEPEAGGRVLRFKGRGAAFHILKARTLAEAVELLVVDHQTRWGPIPDYGATLAHHRGFIGREWLLDDVLTWIEESPRNFLVLEAGPGVGKSGLSVEMIRTVLPDRGHLYVYHLFSRPSAHQPHKALTSLATQLRRLAGIPRRQEDEPGNPVQMLENLLGEVQSGIPDGKRLVLWIDGVDEAVGGRILFPRHLPRGIKAVFTSRSDSRPDWLADPNLVEVMPLDQAAGDHPDDIRRYLSRENEQRRLDLDDAFLEHLTTATRGKFMLAKCYLLPRDNLRDELHAWQRDPSAIPRKVTEWLEGQWGRLKEAAAKQEPPLREDVVRVVLSLLASAGAAVARSLADFPVRRPGRRIAANRYGRAVEGAERSRARPGYGAGLLRVAGWERGAGAYRPFHDDFVTFLRMRSPSLEQRDCHKVLAVGCAAARGQDGPPGAYASRHRMTHLIAADDRAGRGGVLRSGRSERSGVGQRRRGRWPIRYSCPAARGR